MNVNNILNTIYKFYLETFYIKPFVKNNEKRILNTENTIIIASHPRGGSAWLSEILLNIHGSILIDEPLWRGFYKSIDYMPSIQEGKIKQFSQLGFYFDQPIPVDAKWKDATKFMESILKGCFINYDLYEKNKPGSLKVGDIYITKFCYAHLLLPWLLKQFPLKSIVLFRHPCAVVSSQLKHIGFDKIPGNPSGTLPVFEYDAIYRAYSNVWKTISSKEEYLAAIWSVKTKYLHEFSRKNKQILPVFYEDLLINFNEEIDRITNFTGHILQDSVYGYYKKPSSSALKNRSHEFGAKQLTKWKKTLTENQANKILKIVEKFEIDLYNGDFLPHKNPSK